MNFIEKAIWNTTPASLQTGNIVNGAVVSTRVCGSCYVSIAGRGQTDSVDSKRDSENPQEDFRQPDDFSIK